SQVRLLRYALVIRSQGAGFYKIQHTPCELSYTSPPLLKHPLSPDFEDFSPHYKLKIICQLRKSYLYFSRLI
ncbi:hypothetical protein LC605_30470, partial [Nostoc sp. CHAB 5836]|uniref:hypothetical protein n=1 Tax=Nostoc sp. CHAB 5836 TaxID=2780404 RepID=UPI001E3CAA81